MLEFSDVETQRQNPAQLLEIVKQGNLFKFGWLI